MSLEVNLAKNATTLMEINLKGVNKYVCCQNSHEDHYPNRRMEYRVARDRSMQLSEAAGKGRGKTVIHQRADGTTVRKRSN